MKINKLLAFALFFGSSGISQADLLISEVLYDTPGTDSQEEWVEIYNAGCVDESLSGYSISDNSSTYYLSGTLSSGDYITVAKNSSGFQSMYGSSPDISGMTLSLGNSGDWVELKNGSTSVDLVAWENKISGWSITATHESIYRMSSTDTDSVSDWAVSNGDTPGTGPLSTDCSGSGGGLGGVNEAEYYNDAIGLTGSALQVALQEIISNGHVEHSYSDVWTALQYVDEDPGNTDNVILFYTGRSHDKDDRDGQPGFDNQSWNREHIWAKSLGFPNEGQRGYKDYHHIRPTDKTVNSSRGNKDFDDGGSAQGEAADTYTDTNSWEPRDAVKGDVARMIFYMETRYDGSDNDMPDLTIVTHTDTDTGDTEIGVLCTLYSWHALDEVDSFESRRNDRIHELQGNRNPFIDNEQWVEEIWGSQCN